jgi:colanic acid/amylovoran biosynthesis glycosyltransferase
VSKICHIGFDDDQVIKDFIRLHVENLTGEKVCLNHWFPDLKYQGRTIRHFYSRHPLRAKLRKLLPQFLYHRLVTAKEYGEPAILDALGGFFDAHNVDVILAEFGDSGAAICPYAVKLGPPLVVHFHGHDAHRKSLLTAEMRESYQYMFKHASAILVVSRHMEDALVALGCPPERITYNPYGPRESFFEVTPDYRQTVLSVGRFTDIKANYLVLMAFREALKTCPEARLVMAGEGELLETCKTLAEVWGIRDRVDFPGAIAHAEVPRLFAEACCFAQHSVTPSYGDAEGTPNTILEAGAAALPVVATRHAGIADVVVDGATGFLVEERDFEGMARQLVTLLSDPERCREIGAAARQHIRENFSSDRHIARLAAVIKSARGGGCELEE